MGPMTVDGTIVDVHSHWSEDGGRIITEATVQTPDGPVVVSQLGGHADGLGQQVFDNEPLLELGMRVTVAAHADADLSGVLHNVVDGVKVTAGTSFVRTGPTKHGNYLFWESGCVFLTVDNAGTKEVPGDQEFPVIDACIATWTNDTKDCSYLRVIDQGRKDGVEANGKDYTNILKFRDSSWCRPATKDDAAKCYSPDSAGITTATYIDDGGPRDGAIVDADIEINGVDFDITVDDVTLGTHGSKSDLANTLTHELGHLQGLEHTCTVPGDPDRIDGDGHPVPSCGSTSDPKIVDATMYPYQGPNETSKATLEADDIDAICTVYPKAQDPGTCDPVDDGTGCNSSRGPVGPLALVGVLALLGRRKTRRR
jgi:MYXO-CTERM domain-containing protein